MLKRQYWESDEIGDRLTHDLASALQFYHDLLDSDLKREFKLWKSCRRKVIVASDGRLDAAKPASIAVLVVEGDQRKALVADVPEALCKRWSVRKQYIDLVEQSAVVMAIINRPEWFRGAEVIWFIDNSVALSGLVKGANQGVDMDKGCAVVHLALAMLKASVWFEYVESDSNWSDGASRVGLSDKWLRDNRFNPSVCKVPVWPWMAGADQRRSLVEEAG